MRLANHQIEFTFPATPNINNTYTPLTQPAPQEIGSYDVLGYAIDKGKAVNLLQTDAGREQLSPQNGAVAVTEKLLKRGRDALSLILGNWAWQVHFYKASSLIQMLACGYC